MNKETDRPTKKSKKRDNKRFPYRKRRKQEKDEKRIILTKVTKK